MAPSESFKQYGWRSVQLDQYFAAVRIFSYHYGGLKAVYDHLPREDGWPDDVADWSEPARSFFMIASTVLNYMGTTQIFAETPYPELKSLPDDMRKIGFDTCFCFQWTLFEDFVKQRVLGLVDRNVLSPEIGEKLRKLERRTERFLRYIDSGQVFGHSPFRTVLPVPGWVPGFEDCGFADLDAIRMLRNQLIHAPESPPIDRTDQRYDRSMWILRMCAGNIDHAATTVAPAEDAGS
jgi:hypothetical protein